MLFSEMDGIHFLDDGTAVPIWAYGWVTDGFITLPGPLLTYDEGQQVDLNFTNPSPESHTIHLHGLDVDQANDGVPTTSFMVVTGESTVYSFEATHPGTFLYHCHVTTTLHLTMGMYGMILVTRPDGTLWEGGPAYDGDLGGREYFRGVLPGGRLDVSQWPAGSYVAQCGTHPRTRFSVIR